MNIEKLKIVRDSIANDPEEAFCMATFGDYEKLKVPMVYTGSTYWNRQFATLIKEHPLKTGDNPCGSMMCIAGRTTAIFRPKTLIRNALERARAILELSDEEANHLFLGNFGSDLEAITKDQALAAAGRTVRCFWEEFKTANANSLTQEEFAHIQSTLTTGDAYQGERKGGPYRIKLA